MEPDDGSGVAPAAAHSTLACLPCKTRKKKCNKVLPICGYCTKKRLNCVPVPKPTDVSHEIVRHSSAGQTGGSAGTNGLHSITPCDSVGLHRGVHPGIPSTPGPDPTVSLTSLSSAPDLHQQALRLVRATGLFVDDISARYFGGFHRHTPLISRSRFHGSLIAGLGGERAAPGPDFSVLLVVITLLAYSPLAANPNPAGTRQHVKAIPQNGTISHQDLYLAAKSLFGRVQGLSRPPSVLLIQAGLLLAHYEYASGRADDAFASLATCVRMGYVAGLHRSKCDASLPSPPRTPTGSNDADVSEISNRLQAEEAANTWWALIITERMIYPEVSVPDQPLLTPFPDQHARLPTEPAILDHCDMMMDVTSIPDIPLSPMDSGEVGGFGRWAQSSYLANQVLAAFHEPDVNSRLLQLRHLDGALQSFLAVIFPQCAGPWGMFCPAVGTALRALCNLHEHIITLPPQHINAESNPLEGWRNTSRSALVTVTKMLTDIAKTHEGISPEKVDATPPSTAYMMRAALRYLGDAGTDPALPQDAMENIRVSERAINRRWGVEE